MVGKKYNPLLWVVIVFVFRIILDFIKSDMENVIVDIITAIILFVLILISLKNEKIAKERANKDKSNNSKC